MTCSIIRKFSVNRSHIGEEYRPPVVFTHAASHQVRVLYTWQRVQDVPYTVCIAYPDERRDRPPRAPQSPPPDLVYHRIDLSRSHKVALCRQFRHMATMSELYSLNQRHGAPPSRPYPPPTFISEINSDREVQ